ncbi:TetR/AcrR family transcriptional regulator [Engelhardtia mirabilis]|uniref:HTH-type transcriptional repressor ComR n=1 Tax=Engelhardtia mirabilis TaxID=2528011 RepID=A0A518BR33_9BACT|nr:HTH-type transcriptional repressor ComR [Planctomycetes bacterium Pla133]QDV03767.1 HTH-type transcriptional repressor ComR [Planctomycetes bacterium Pla86]
MSARHTATPDSAPRRLGRPREFDEDEVLDAALDAFWRKGFEATSMADLIEATGLHKGSLYKAFGDKRSLFLTTLRRYLARGHAKIEATLAGEPTPEAKLDAWMNAMLGSCDAADNRGCYAINVEVELGPHDPEIAKVVGDHFDEVRELVTAIIAEGQASGVFRADRDASDLAEFLAVFAIGAVTRSKGKLEATQARRLARSAIDAVLA